MKSSTKSNTSTPISIRYHFLDVIRAITLINLIAYHALYDLVYLYHISIPFYTGKAGYLWQQSICWTFIFLSGISFHFGRHPIKRACVLTLSGMVITLITLFFMPELPVYMGILSFMGMAWFIMILVQPLLKKLDPFHGFLLSSVLFIVFRDINQGILGFESIHILTLPDWLYKSHIGFIFGFPTDSFISGDYFSLIPWIFLYLSGYFFWKLIQKKEAVLTFLQKGNIPFFNQIGKHTLPVYLIHQPLLLLLFEFLF